MINSNFLLSIEYLLEIFLSLMILLQIITISLYKVKFSINNLIQFQTWTILFFSLLILFIVIFESNTYTNETIFIFTYANIKTLKFLILFLSITVFGAISLSYKYETINIPEFFTLFLISILATLLILSATDFLTIFLLLEMQSLSFYILASIKKNSIFSIRAGQNYFIFNSIVSCILLFSISLLYGFYGTLSFAELFSIMNEYNYITREEFFFTPWPVCIIIYVLLIKITIVPFHFWIVDIYDGSPLSSTIIFSYLPKIMLFDLLIKINQIFWVFSYELSFIYIITGLITIFYGGILMLNKFRFKKFLIYSSISQMGFPILSLGLWTQESWSYIYFFIFIYIITSSSLWILYTNLTVQNSKHNFIKKKCLYLSDLSSFFYLDSKYFLFLLIFFFSSAGVPPFAGFYAKALVVLSAEKNYIYTDVSKILVLLTILAVFYYIRIIKIFIFDNNKKNIITKLNMLHDQFYLDYNNFVLILFSTFLTFSCFFIDYLIIFIKNIVLTN